MDLDFHRVPCRNIYLDLFLDFFKWKWTGTGTETTWPIAFNSLRFQLIRPVHTTPILLRFQVFPLWWAFSKVCVFIENDTSFSSFSCGRDMKTQQNICFFKWKRRVEFIFEPQCGSSSDEEEGDEQEFSSHRKWQYSGGRSCLLEV